MDRKLVYFIEYLLVPLFSDIANYKKEISYVLSNATGEVRWSCTVCHHHHTVTIIIDIANYTKEIRIAKYSMRGDVCGHVLSPPYILQVVSITNHTHDRRKLTGKRKHTKEKKI